MFVSTQQSVEFHHTILKNVLGESDSEDAETTPGDLVIYKLHGDMPQKVGSLSKNVILTIFIFIHHAPVWFESF